MKVQIRALKTFFVEFCANSTIHGVRYFTEKKTHWSERFWWAVEFVLSVWLCGYSIQQIWTKWDEKPIVMTISEKEAPISTIPFPGVTICPQTKTKKEKLDLISAYNLLKKKAENNLTAIQSFRLQTLFHLCEFYVPKHFRFGEEHVNGSIYDTIRDIAPSFNETMDLCEWETKYFPCSERFSAVFTQEGLCFTFNNLNSRDIYTEEMAPETMIVKSNPNVSHWSHDNGYDKSASNDKEYPIRVFNSKHGYSLSVYPMLFERDFETLCKEAIHGYKVFLGVPGDSVEMSQLHLRIPILERVEILIKAELVTTSEDLRSYRPNRRGCFYSSERKLRFFKSYTLNNCEAECLANFTATQCGCVKFSMPRERGGRICGSANVRCYQETEKKLFGEDIIDGLKDAKAKSFRLGCNCLPACTTITYKAVVDRTIFNFEGILKSYQISLEQYSGVKPSHLLVSFEDQYVVTLERSALYTFADFLAICGGLLGLFLGVSALSIIEFFYYSTLRLYWKLRQMKNEKTSKKIAPSKSSRKLKRLEIKNVDSVPRRF